MFRRFGSAEVLSVHTAAPEPVHVRKQAHRAVFSYVPEEGYVYVRSRAISSRCNDNFDYFPAEEIKQAYKTFIGKPVFVNHHNEDHRRARGVIIDAALHEDQLPDGSGPDTWVEVLMKVDGKTYPKLAQALINGDIDRTSMGTDVQISKCSVCGNQAKNPTQYCRHIPAMKGQRIYQPDPQNPGRKIGKLVFEECYGLHFFENSLLVEPPADPTAFFLDKPVVGPGLEHIVAKSNRLQAAAAEQAPPQRITRAAARAEGQRRIAASMRRVAGFLDDYPSDDEIDQMRNGTHPNNQGGFGGNREPWKPYRHELENRPEPRTITPPMVKGRFEGPNVGTVYHPVPHGTPGAQWASSPSEEYHGPYEVVRHAETGKYHVVDNAERKTQYGRREGEDDVHKAQFLRDYADHAQGAKERARGLIEGLHERTMQILDPGGTDESRHSERNTRTMNDLLSYGYQPHQIKFDEDDDAYGETEHRLPNGKPSGWVGRDYGGHGYLHIGHKATGDEMHEGIHLAQSDENGRDYRIPGYGPAEAHQDLDHWYHDQESGTRGYLEEDDPRIKRWLRRNPREGARTAAGERRFFSEHPSGYRAEWRGGPRFHVYEGDTPVDSPSIRGYSDALRSGEVEELTSKFTQRKLDQHLNRWVKENGDEYSRFNHPDVEPMSYADRQRFKEMDRRQGSRQVIGGAVQDRANAYLAAHPIDAKHIVDRVRKAAANPQTLHSGMKWYDDAHGMAKTMASHHGVPLSHVAGTLGVYSASSAPAPNFHMASTALHAGRGVYSGYLQKKNPETGKMERVKDANGNDIWTGDYGGKGGQKPENYDYNGDPMASAADAHKVDRILSGEHYEGVIGSGKTKTYARLIENPDNDQDVVIDRHAVAAAVNHTGKSGEPYNAVAGAMDNVNGGNSLYQQFSEAYRQAAKHINKSFEFAGLRNHLRESGLSEDGTIKPHQVQALAWIVQKEHSDQFGHDMGQSNQNAIDRWQDHYTDRYGVNAHQPVSGKGFYGQEPYAPPPKRRKAAMRNTGLRETRAPQDVDTLRDESCPICGNDQIYNGRECSQCGYIQPPKGLGDPDVQKAQQLDQLKEQVEDARNQSGADPSQPGADFEAGDLSQLEPGGDNSANPWLTCTNCGTGVRPAAPETVGEQQGMPPSDGPSEGDACPVCGKGELVSSGVSEDDTDAEQAAEDEDAEDPDADADEDDEDDDEQPPSKKNPKKVPAS